MGVVNRNSQFITRMESRTSSETGCNTVSAMQNIVYDGRCNQGEFQWTEAS